MQMGRMEPEDVRPGTLLVTVKVRIVVSAAGFWVALFSGTRLTPTFLTREEAKGWVERQNERTVKVRVGRVYAILEGG